MKNAYALLGLAFLLVFGAALFLFNKAEAPTDLPANHDNDGMSFTLSSTAFKDGEMIPAKYTCDGENVSPPLTISGVPEGTESLVLIMDDPDIPEEVKAARGIEKFDHWAVYNLPADTTEISEGTSLGTTGLNGAGNSGYTGPCPPPQYEPKQHRYVFRVYALPNIVNFFKQPTLGELDTMAESVAIAKATLIGVYERN